jgi:hypothetical protein
VTRWVKVLRQSRLFDRIAKPGGYHASVTL